MTRLRARAILFTVVTVAICFLGSYAAAHSGAPAILLATATAAFGVIAIVSLAVILTPGRRQLRFIQSDATGAHIGLSNSPVLAVICSAAIGFFVLFVVGIAVDWIFTGRPPITAARPIIFLGVVVIFAVPSFIALMRGRYRLGGLRIDPERIVYSSYAKQNSIAWSDVIKVSAPSAPPSVHIYGRTGGLHIPTAVLRVDSTALRDCLDFYREHPASRSELATVESLRRFADPHAA